jgi:hypothetical protein
MFIFNLEKGNEVIKKYIAGYDVSKLLCSVQ